MAFSKGTKSLQIGDILVTSLKYRFTIWGYVKANYALTCICWIIYVTTCLIYDLHNWEGDLKKRQIHCATRFNNALAQLIASMPCGFGCCLNTKLWYLNALNILKDGVTVRIAAKISSADFIYLIKPLLHNASFASSKTLEVNKGKYITWFYWEYKWQNCVHKWFIQEQKLFNYVGIYFCPYQALWYSNIQ